MNKMDLSVSKTFYVGQNRNYYTKNQEYLKTSSQKPIKNTNVSLGSDVTDFNTLQQTNFETIEEVKTKK